MNRLALWSILVLGIGVRVLFLFQPIALDEATTYVYYASQPLPLALSDYSAPNNHLFHTLLVHLATRFGNAEWIIRLPAFLAGIAIIPATYAVGKRLYSENAGLLAAALVAASSALIEYSTNARGYTLVTLFTLLLILTSIRLIERESWRLWGQFVVFSALGFYTIPTMLYPVLSVIVWLALTFAARKQWRRLPHLLGASIGIGIVTLCLYLPVILRMGIEPVTSNAFVRPQPEIDFLQELTLSISRIWLLAHVDFPTVIHLLLVGMTIAATIFHKSLSHFRISFLLVAVVVSVALVLFGQRAPYARVWLWLLPLYFVTAAGVFRSLERHPAVQRFAPVMTVLVCASLCFYTGNARSQHAFVDVALEPDAENVVLVVKDYIQLTADYEIVPVSSPLVYYFMRHGIPLDHLGGDLAQVYTSRLFVVVLEPDYTLDSLLELLQEYGLNLEPYPHRIRLAQFETASLWELTQ